MATDKMNDDSMVALRRSGRGHVDKLRLRTGAQAVDDFILTAGSEAGDAQCFKEPARKRCKGIVK